MNLITILGYILVAVGTGIISLKRRNSIYKKLKKPSPNVGKILGIFLITSGSIISATSQGYEYKKGNEELLKSYDSLQTNYQNLSNKNTELLERIEQYQNDIEQKNLKIEQLKKEIEKSDYKPLNENIKTKINESLSLLRKVMGIKYKIQPDDIKFDFGTLNRNLNTDYITRDLRNILSKANFLTTQPSSSTIIHSHLKKYSIPVIISHPSNEGFAAEVTGILRLYIINLKYVTDLNQRKSTLNFQFYGFPEFSEDGEVSYNE